MIGKDESHYLLNKIMFFEINIFQKLMLKISSDVFNILTEDLYYFILAVYGYFSEGIKRVLESLLLNIVNMTHYFLQKETRF